MNTESSVEPPPNPGVVCVLGMHRSGTSVVTRLLNLIGLSLGPPDKLLAPEADNPKGFWEYAPFVRINDDILARLGGNWHEPPTFPAGWEHSADLADLRQQARSLIGHDFPPAGWAWKDPRTCLTLPFWIALLPALRCVVCIRSPSEVVQSLARRDRFTPDKSVRLWHRYTASSLTHSAGRPSLTIFYEDLLTDPRHEAARLAAFVGSPVLHPGVLRDGVAEELCHHRDSFLDTIDRAEIPFPTRSLYLALRLSVRGPQGPDESMAQLWPSFGRSSYKTLEEADEQVRAVVDQITQLATSRKEIETLQARATAAEEDAAGARAELARREVELAETLAHQKVDSREREAAWAGERAAMEEVIAGLRADLAGRAVEVSRLVRELGHRETDLAAERSAAADLRGLVAQRDQAIHDLQAQVRTAEAAAGQAAADLGHAAADLEEARQALAARAAAAV